MASLLAIESRRTEKSATLVPELRRYVARQYAEDPDQYADDFRTLELLRNDLVFADASEAGLRKLWRYYGQLTLISLKFPADEVNLRAGFTWSAAYAPQKRPAQGFGLGFDRLCVMWNIAAAYSAVGVAEYRMTPEGAKKAAACFQHAASVFSRMREELAAGAKVTPPPDISDGVLAACAGAMLAQAQECYWAKAVVDKLKDGTVAKLAAAVAERYAASLGAATGAKMPASFTAHVHVKMLHFEAAAQYRQGLVCNAESRFGEEIARLKLALATAAKAQDKELQKNAGSVVLGDLKALVEHTTERLSRAEKDNNVIYVQRIPAPDQLSAIPRANMASDTPFPPPLPDGTPSRDCYGPPLFERLVPFEVHRALSFYSQRRDDLVRAEEEKLREATDAAWAALASMNLPAAIEALEQPIGLPPALLERSGEVRSEGGAKSLEDAWATVRNLAKRDAEMLAEAVRLLDEEAESDGRVREHYGARWTRAASAELAANLRETARAYGDKLEQARRSDALVRGKLDRHLPAIMALDGTRDQLEASVPAARPGTTPDRHDPNVPVLKQQIAQLHKIVSARAGIMERFRKMAREDDITPRLLDLASRNEDYRSESVLTAQLDRYADIRNEVAMSVEAQRQMLEVISQTNERFVRAKKSNTVLQDRERALQNLDSAYKAFKDISTNLNEGTRFYTDFQAVLQRFLDNVKDYAFARKIDMQELLRALTSNIASMRLSADSIPELPDPVVTAFPAASVPSPFPASAAPVRGGYGLADPTAPPAPAPGAFPASPTAPGAFPEDVPLGQAPPPYTAPPPGAFNPDFFDSKGAPSKR
ncbi:BRO1-like domain-containing protein [Hyaloraphidium curvatum]|nr:BRO1-like domain-containing protein [Hyaloraphidium curvatum]